MKYLLYALLLTSCTRQTQEPTVKATLISQVKPVSHVDNIEVACAMALTPDIEPITIKAWGIDKTRLKTDRKYYIEQYTKYFNFLKEMYRDEDFTTWQCAIASKYNTRNGFCIKWMEKYRNCLKTKERENNYEH